MFSNRLYVRDTKSIVLSELQSSGSLTSQMVDATGLSWTLLYLWGEDGRIYCKVGLDQPSDCVLGVAVQASFVVQSSSARLRRSFIYTLTCSDARNCVWWWKIANPTQMEQLIEGGELKISTTLQIFKSIKFRTIPQAAVYGVNAPAQCEAILGIDHEGSVYVLRKLTVLEPQIEQWCVYCFRRLLPDHGVNLAHIDMRPSDFRGTGFDRENRRLAVTQIDENDSSLQLDIVDWGSGEQTTETYELEDQHLQWSAATPHKHGWLCIASGKDELPPSSVEHRFWLLDDDGDLELLAEFVEEETPNFCPLKAASLNGNYYCLTIKRDYGFLVWVTSWEESDPWRPYGLAPTPDFHLFPSPLCIRYEWGHLLLIGQLFRGRQRQYAIFKLSFEVTDCLLEPFIILPKGVQSWRMCEDGFVAFVRAENAIRFFGIKPHTLKIRTMLTDGVMDTERKQKLTHLLGELLTNTFLY